MAFCRKCGTQVEESISLCPSCGEEIGKKGAKKSSFQEISKNLKNVSDTTSEFDSADITENKVMAIMSYLGIFVLIPIFAAKESKFAQFHANQGLALLIASIAYGIAYGILSAIIMLISQALFSLVGLLGFVGWAFLALAIIGIINAASGKAKELPIIGKIRILK